MLVIPAIDIIENKAVRLSKGDFGSKKIYSDNLLELVKQFYEAGFKRIHVVDLEASKTGSFTCLNLLQEIKNQYEIEIQFGGGIRTKNDLQNLENAGVDYFILGSITVKEENSVEQLIKDFETAKIIFAADVLDKKIKVSGWTESTDILINQYIEKWQKKNIKKFLCTDISKDGMLQGPSFILYQELMNNYPNVDLIASGGISQLDDLVKLNKQRPLGII